MRKPQPPPDLGPTIASLRNRPVILDRMLDLSIYSDRYLPWDELRWRKPPDGLTREEWWAATKVGRAGMRRPLPLFDVDGARFSFALPDDVLQAVEVIDRHASGRIGTPEPVANAGTRDYYIINSLFEEAITSSQLEGAATTYRVAKDMLRSGRRPRTVDERMILNNYRAMRRVSELRTERLTPELICEIHRVVTEGTLENPQAAGRFQLPGEPRVLVMDDGNDVLHTPPPAEQLPERVQRLCDFAGGRADESYVPPVLRAVIVHFMLAYDHPFVDGNGRTARALFYWSMLNADYWLTEFLPISRLIRKGPAKYARAFLHTEQDDGDITYFAIYHLGILRRAIEDLHAYLDAEAADVRRLESTLAGQAAELNHRQYSVLRHALMHPSAEFSVARHASTQGVALQTARNDLRLLEERGLLRRVNRGRGHAWTPVDDLRARLAGRLAAQ